MHENKRQQGFEPEAIHIVANEAARDGARKKK